MKNLKNNFALFALIIGLFLTFSHTAQAATYTVDRTDDATVSICDAATADDCTLRGAIAAANAAATDDVINFDPTVFNTPQTITLIQGDLQVIYGVTISGPGANLLTISGNDANRVFSFTSAGTNSSLSGLTVSNGNGIGASNGSGGGIDMVRNTLTINNCIIRNNSSGGTGGGINAFIGTIFVNNSTVSNNSATDAGGGIYNTNNGTITTINNSTISNNTSAGGGGGISSSGTIINSTVSNNSANGGSGGGASGSNLTVTNSTFSGNSASTSGGGVIGSILTMTASTVSSNSASSGGGVFVNSTSGGTSTINNSTISNNTATSNGGGISKSGLFPLSINNSTVSNNTATGSGGGIYYNNVANTSTFNLTGSTVSNNSAATGGGILGSNGTLNLQSTIIANSTSGGDCVRTVGTFNASYSLIEGGLGCVNGTSSNNLTGDPNLEALGDNGGSTFTHKLLPGSIAIDAGSNALVPVGITTDQRGQNRIIDGDGNGSAIVDMGSFEALGTTAASVSISGRVSDGSRGISRAIVHITDQDGNIRTARTNPFGYYRFTDVAVGQTLIVNVFHKQYQFNPQVVSVNDSIANMDFTPQTNQTNRK